MNCRAPLLVFALLLTAASAASACTIPVFRYALERWQLGSHEVIIFHRGPMTPEQKAIVKHLEGLTGKVNLEAQTVDLGGKVEPAIKKLWELHGKNASVPTLLIRSSETDANTPPLWSGPLTDENVRKLVDSPRRSQLVERLSKGDSAVFLLLQSGDKEQDSAAEKQLRAQLTMLEKKLTLPEQAADGPQLKYALPLKIGFSILPIARDDSAEALFVHLLLQCEEGLTAVKGPIAFPVFGRGRLLCSLHGKHNSEDSVSQVCRFLCSACSCQVKELNPGIDLLISADWPTLLARTGEAGVPKKEEKTK